jgi:RNA recognition motif-containing protein
MSMNIYVGNLPFGTSENQLRELFERYGPVESVRLITDRDTGRSRGFGFVRMAQKGASEAIEALNGTSLEGRNLRVNEARPREGDRRRRAF